MPSSNTTVATSSDLQEASFLHFSRLSLNSPMINEYQNVNIQKDHTQFYIANLDKR